MVACSPSYCVTFTLWHFHSDSLSFGGTSTWWLVHQHTALSLCGAFSVWRFLSVLLSRTVTFCLWRFYSESLDLIGGGPSWDWTEEFNWRPAGWLWRLQLFSPLWPHWAGSCWRRGGGSTRLGGGSGGLLLSLSGGSTLWVTTPCGLCPRPQRLVWHTLLHRGGLPPALWSSHTRPRQRSPTLCGIFHSGGGKEGKRWVLLEDYLFPTPPCPLPPLPVPPAAPSPILFRITPPSA